MAFKKLLPRFMGGGGVLALATLATGGLFKIAAFAREAFIASRFGLSSLTDAYFAFQQFPLMLATFMFGAFALAFTPVYAADKRQTGKVEWLPGLIVYGSALGAVLTLVMIVFAPGLVGLFIANPAPHAATTLVILSCAFAPIMWLGVWSGTAIAAGNNLAALFVTGLPYLFMTLLLLGVYALGGLNDLTLPVSFLAGFGGIGICMLYRVAATQGGRTPLRALLNTWRMPGFRRFLKQLTASFIENLGYSANQLLLIFFVAQAGTGSVSANTCAMRVGMLGFSLMGQPLAQLVQAKLCAVPDNERAEVFKKWLLAVAGVVIAFAALLYLFRLPVTSAVYLHGKFSSVDLERVIEIMPAWVAYFVVLSLNAIAARYLFTTTQGVIYVRRQLGAYLGANLIRVAFWGRLSAPAVIWCSVLAEGCGLLVNLHSCLRATLVQAPEPILAAQEV